MEFFMLFRLSSYGWFLALVIGMGTECFAQDGGDEETNARIRALELRVQQLEQALVEALALPSPAPESSSATEAVPGTAPTPERGDQGLTARTGVAEAMEQQGAYDYDKAMFGPIKPLESADGRFKTFVFGYLQADIAAYSQSGDWNGIFETGAENGSVDTDFSGGAKMRRVSLNVASIVEQDWIGFLSYNLADGGSEVDSGLRAAAIVYRGIRPWWLMAGQFGNSVGLESSTFNTYLSMVERPMIANAFVYAPGAPVMALIAAHRGQLTYARAGIFGKNTKVDSEFDEGWGVHGRFLLQPNRERRLSSQVGVSGYWRKPEEETVGDGHSPSCRARDIGSGFRFNTSGISAVDGTSLVDTEKFCDVEDYTYTAAEGAYSRGPLWVQGEWGIAKVNTKANGSYEFDGGYIDLGYFLTGESRNYNPYFGQFWRLKPQHDLGAGGAGAFELRARWQTIDLNDRVVVDGGTLKGVAGGEAEGFSIGLNWYVNAFAVAMFNAGRMNVEYPMAEGGRLGTREAKVDEYVARFQLSF